MPSTKRKSLVKSTADPQRLLVIINHRPQSYHTWITTCYKWWPSSSMDSRKLRTQSQFYGQHQQAIWYRIQRIFKDNLSRLRIPRWLQGNNGPMAGTMMNGALANRCFREKPQGYSIQISTSQGPMSLPGKICAWISAWDSPMPPIASMVPLGQSSNVGWNVSRNVNESQAKLQEPMIYIMKVWTLSFFCFCRSRLTGRNFYSVLSHLMSRFKIFLENQENLC